MATTFQGVAGRLGAWYAHGPDRRTAARVGLVLALALAAALGAAGFRLAGPAAPTPVQIPRTQESAAPPTVTALSAVEQTAAPAGPRVIRSDTPIVIRGRGPRSAARSMVQR